MHFVGNNVYSMVRVVDDNTKCNECTFIEIVFQIALFFKCLKHTNGKFLF